MMCLLQDRALMTCRLAGVLFEIALLVQSLQASERVLQFSDSILHSSELLLLGVEISAEPFCGVFGNLQYYVLLRHKMCTKDRFIPLVLGIVCLLGLK